MHYLPHNFILKEHIVNALKEDIGNGDITTDLIVKPGQVLKAVFNTRVEGIFCGAEIIRMVFETLDPQLNVHLLVKDGESICKNQDLAIIEGNARAILSGERIALNFIQKMSAIATLTNKYQQATLPFKAKVTETRKTTPNFRIFEKYAVTVGGGSPHRFGLYDCVMIKDNHIKLAGSIQKAVTLVKNGLSHTKKIEVETENLNEVKEALKAGADIILLDNMTIDEMNEAVKLINNRTLTEASGNVTMETINSVASTGVDLISTSAITSKAASLDIGLDIE